MQSEPPEREDRPLGLLAAAGWTLLVKLLFEVSVGLLEAAHPGALSDLVSVTAARVLAVSFVLFALVRVHEPESALRRVLAVRRPPVLVLVAALLAGAAFAVPASWIGAAVAEHLPKPEESELYARLLSTETPARRAIVIASLVFVMPISDELFFRGALFTSLEREHPRRTLVFAAAALDALLNFDPRALVTFALALLGLGWMRAVTRSVLPSVVARVGFFAVLVVPETLDRPGPPATWGYVLGATAAAVLSLALIGIVARAAHRSGPGDPDDADDVADG